MNVIRGLASIDSYNHFEVGQPTVRYEHISAPIKHGASLSRKGPEPDT